MKKLLFVVLILATIAFARMDDYVPGSMIIMLEPELQTVCEFNSEGILITGIDQIDELNAELGAKSGRYIMPIRQMSEEKARLIQSFRNVYKINFEDHTLDIPSVCELYKNLPGVVECDPNWIKEYSVVVPDDPKYDDAWHLSKIRANDVWPFSTGDSSVSVSCFESIDWKHPDIAPVVWNNLGEDADGDGKTLIYSGGRWRYDPDDIDGIDNDENGYVDDFIGWDFIEGTCGWESMHPDEDCDDQDNDPMDEIGYVGHGTHVSGTMTIASNNGEGCASICWQPKILCLRTDYTYMGEYGWHGAHHTDATVEAFGYAIANGCDVFCLSYGGYSYSGVVAAIMREAWDDANIVIAAASGNENTEELSYPASYTHVLGVAATTPGDIRADFSNYGDRIDISAPGTGIWSAVPRHDLVGGDRSFPYEATDGTSMATPVVAGAAAMLFSLYPDASNLDVYLMITEHADEMPDCSYFDSGLMGEGRLNVYRAAFQDNYCHFDLDSIGFYPDPADEDGKVNVGETGYIVASYTSDPEFQDPGDITISLSCNDDDVTFGSDYTTTGLVAGDEVDNFGSPLSFVPGESFIDGHTVIFTVRIESSTGYFREDTISVLLGFPSLLIYDRDGGAGNETYIFNDLQRGNVEYDHWDADASGPIDATFLTDNYKTILFLNGDNEESPITAEEISAFETFLDMGDDRNILFAGQYLADCGIAQDFIENYLKTEHVADEVDSRFWAVSIVGESTCEVTNGMDINAVMGVDCFGLQYSLGQCNALAGASNAMYYNDHDDVYCATVYEGDGYKSFFGEFSIDGITGSNPGASTRFGFLWRILTWFGHEFTSVEEQVSFEPSDMTLPSAYPNPFNGAVNIEFTLLSKDNVDITVYDLSGKKVANLIHGQRDSGTYTVNWTPNTNLASGVYMYKINGRTISHSGRLLYVR